MNTEWKALAVSVVGNDHVRRETPCQDASAAFAAPRSAVVVCDGAGSSTQSHIGATEAVRAFRIAVATLEPLICDVLDSERVPWSFAQDLWRYVAGWICRALVAAKGEAARAGTGNPRDYDFTFAATVVGRLRTGFVQVGDGAIAVRTCKGSCELVLTPEKGRFANATRFLDARTVDEAAYQTRLLPTAAVDGVMVMSDGPEIKMLNLAAGKPALIVAEMLDDLATGELDRTGILNYLTGSRWCADPRGGDDKSIAMLVRVKSMPGDYVSEHL